MEVMSYAADCYDCKRLSLWVIRSSNNLSLEIAMTIRQHKPLMVLMGNELILIKI